MSSTANASKARVAAAVMAMLALIGSAAVMIGVSETEAAISGDYGQVYEIDLAPGFSYTYTPTYPADLDVTTTIHDYESAGLDAVMNGSTLTVSVASGVTSGSYDLVLKAESNTGGVNQVAYQHIRFNIVSGLVVDPSQVINDIILGASVNFTPSASSDMGAITWTAKQLPAGLRLSGGVVSGTPTQVGLNTLVLTATAYGQTQDLTITFTVYNVIVGGSDETIYSNGNTVSSTAISQTGSDLGVTWRVTSGTLPSGFSLNASTGVISGSSTTLQETTVTITGTSANGPSQTTSKDVTIRSEPAISITAPSSTVTVYDGSEDATLQLSATRGTSAVTWSVSSATGVSINSSTGLLTVTDAASAGTVTVTARTAYGGSTTFDVTIAVESTATISGSSAVTATTSTPATERYTSNVAGTWSVDTASVPSGTVVSIDSSGNLTVSGSSATETFQVIVTLTTASGQEATMTVTCQVIPALAFTSEPSNGLIAVEV